MSKKPKNILVCFIALAGTIALNVAWYRFGRFAGPRIRLAGIEGLSFHLFLSIWYILLSAGLISLFALVKKGFCNLQGPKENGAVYLLSTLFKIVAPGAIIAGFVSAFFEGFSAQQLDVLTFAFSACLWAFFAPCSAILALILEFGK